MQEASSADNTSFFRLPLLFVLVWLGAGYLWVYVILPKLLTGYVFYYLWPLIQLNSITEWIVYSPLFFVVTSFVFLQRHFSRADSGAVIRVIIMAVICFVLIEAAGFLQLMMTLPGMEKRPHFSSPPVLMMTLHWFLKLLVAVAVVWLTTWLMTRACSKNTPASRLTSQNHRLVNSVLLVIPMLVIYFLTSFLIFITAADSSSREGIIQFVFILFTSGFTDLLLQLLIMASVLIAILYSAFGYSGEQLRVKRLLLTAVAGALVIGLVYYGLIFISFYFTGGNTYGNPDATEGSVTASRYLGLVIAGFILRMMVKKLFREIPASEPMSN